MLRFSIRDVLWLTALVAVLLMWWLERNQNLKNEARLTALEARLHTHKAGGIAATIHASSNTPYSQIDSLLKAMQRAGVEDITIAQP
jgi:biopolymer transport protein ExbD